MLSNIIKIYTTKHEAERKAREKAERKAEYEARREKNIIKIVGDLNPIPYDTIERDWEDLSYNHKFYFRAKQEILYHINAEINNVDSSSTPPSSHPQYDKIARKVAYSITRIGIVNMCDEVMFHGYTSVILDKNNIRDWIHYPKASFILFGYESYDPLIHDISGKGPALPPRVSDPKEQKLPSLASVGAPKEQKQSSLVSVGALPANKTQDRTKKDVLHLRLIKNSLNATMFEGIPFDVDMRLLGYIRAPIRATAIGFNEKDQDSILTVRCENEKDVSGLDSIGTSIEILPVSENKE